MKNTTITTEQGNTYTFTRTTNDANGNPRYIIHFLDLGLEEYASNETTRQAGLSLYRGKSYGGGFVCQSYNLEGEAQWFEKLSLFCK